MKVSIVTPTYRHREFIGQAIDSVLAQTYSDWEMIIVDDGSDDGTADIARGYADSRISVIERAHEGIQGLDKTYNSALAKATGELIAILEGDDWWAPEKLAAQVPDFEAADVVMSYGLYSQVQDGQETPSAMPDLPNDVIRNNPVGSATYAMLKPTVLTFPWPVTVVMRAGALRRIGGFQMSAPMGVVDYPTLLCIGLEGEWRFHPQVLGYWRRHARSETRSRFPEILSGARIHSAEFIAQHRDRIPGDLDNIRHLWQSMQLIRTYSLSIILADENRFAESANALRHALSFKVGPKTKAMLVAALVAAKLKKNPEAVFARFGYRGYREAARLGSGDALVATDMSLELLAF